MNYCYVKDKPVPTKRGFDQQATPSASHSLLFLFLFRVETKGDDAQRGKIVRKQMTK